MAARRHRNLFRERLEAHAREREASGLEPFTHAGWAEYFNEHRPTIGGRRVSEIGYSTVSRACSTTPGVARRHGPDRAWILTLLGIDYAEYIAAWGRGPEGSEKNRARRGRVAVRS